MRGATLQTWGLVEAWWQYLLLFLAVTASWAGVPMIGAAAAGAAGVAASQGRLSLPVVIAVSVLAGEVGGWIGYRIGFRWGRLLVERPGKHQAYRVKVLARGEHAYARWGRIAVFVTPAIVSGTAKMPLRQFLVWNFLASIGFTLSVVTGAYGISRLLTGHHEVKDVSILVVGVCVGFAILHVVRRHHQRSLARSGAAQADDEGG